MLFLFIIFIGGIKNYKKRSQLHMVSTNTRDVTIRRNMLEGVS